MRQSTLPDEAQVLAEMAEAEDGSGWLAVCAEKSRFVVITAEMVDALAAVLGTLGQGPVLEVAAGDGRLAEALNAAGIAVIATDLEQQPGSGVNTMAAAEALRRYHPRVVLGCFVPAGSGVDPAVLAAPSVEHYVVINARLGGTLGDGWLWSVAGWEASPLPELTGSLITRHDVWIAPDRPILRRGEAWLFRRKPHETGTGQGVSRPG